VLLLLRLGRLVLLLVVLLLIVLLVVLVLVLVVLLLVVLLLLLFLLPLLGDLQVPLGARVARVQRQRAPVGLDRLLELVLLEERVPEVVEGQGLERAVLGLGRAQELLACLVEARQRVKRGPAVEVH